MAVQMLTKEVKETRSDDLLNCPNAPHGYRWARLFQMVTINISLSEEVVKKNQFCFKENS